MQINEYNKEVFFVSEQFIEVRRDHIEYLKEKCLHNNSGKARLCTHKDINSPIHEMLIVHAKGAYVRPHKHLNKIESFHVIEGSAKAVIFDEGGSIIKATVLGDYLSGKNFCWKFTEPYYHTLIIDSDFFVFHEVTNGPFNRAHTVFAPWAPVDEKPIIDKFMNKIKIEAGKLLESKGQINEGFIL